MDRLCNYQTYLTNVGTDIAKKLETGMINNNSSSWDKWLQEYNNSISPQTQYNYAMKIAKNLNGGGMTKRKTKTNKRKTKTNKQKTKTNKQKTKTNKRKTKLNKKK